jgi:hypothetical protein
MPLVKEPIWLFLTIEQFVYHFLSHIFYRNNSFRYLSDLPTDMHKFDLEEDRHIFQELQSVCKFTEEFEELK